MKKTYYGIVIKHADAYYLELRSKKLMYMDNYQSWSSLNVGSAIMIVVNEDGVIDKVALAPSSFEFVNKFETFYDEQMLLW